jgi:hypothetical protein
MGKKGHDLPKILRQELVLNIVENFAGDQGILTAEIFELLENKCPGVNRRTLHRDLLELSERYPIFDDLVDGKTKWFMRNDLNQSQMKSIFREYIQNELMKSLNVETKEKEVELTPLK